MRTEDGGRSWTPVKLPLRAERAADACATSRSSGAEQGWVVGETGHDLPHGGRRCQRWTRQESGVPIVRTIPKGEHRAARGACPSSRPSRTGSPCRRSSSRTPARVGGGLLRRRRRVRRCSAPRTAARRGGSSTFSRASCCASLFVLDADHAWAAGDRARTDAPGRAPLRAGRALSAAIRVRSRATARSRPAASRTPRRSARAGRDPCREPSAGSRRPRDTRRRWRFMWLTRSQVSSASQSASVDVARLLAGDLLPAGLMGLGQHVLDELIHRRRGQGLGAADQASNAASRACASSAMSGT